MPQMRRLMDRLDRVQENMDHMRKKMDHMKKIDEERKAMHERIAREYNPTGKGVANRTVKRKRGDKYGNH